VPLYTVAAATKAAERFFTRDQNPVASAVEKGGGVKKERRESMPKVEPAAVPAAQARRASRLCPHMTVQPDTMHLLELCKAKISAQQERVHCGLGRCLNSITCPQGKTARWRRGKYFFPNTSSTLHSQEVISAPLALCTMQLRAARHVAPTHKRAQRKSY